MHLLFSYIHHPYKTSGIHIAGSSVSSAAPRKDNDRHVSKRVPSVRLSGTVAHSPSFTLPNPTHPFIISRLDMLLTEYSGCGAFCCGEVISSIYSTLCFDVIARSWSLRAGRCTCFLPSSGTHARNPLGTAHEALVRLPRLMKGAENVRVSDVDSYTAATRALRHPRD